MSGRESAVEQVPSGEDTLGTRLRVERERRGLSLRELARRLEVSPSLVSQIETGKTQPSVRTLYAIVSELIGLDRMFFFEAAYTSISRVVRGFNGSYVVSTLNETAHLHSAPRTLEPLPPI